MMSPDDGIRVLAPLSFKVADKFFKFLTWAFALAALQFASKTSPNIPLSWILYLAQSVYVSTLILQCFYIAMRHPSTLNVPKKWYGVSQVIQVFVGLIFLLALTSPALYLDQVFDALIQVRAR